jgi:flavin reductase (DIM6/NTAB) family NADH-FMN oxidoreductase RutF
VTIDPEALRNVMRRWATGVTLVTASAGGKMHGMTVTSFTSVSLEPPLILVSIEQNTRTHRMIQEAGAFSIALLAEDQRTIADRFAGAISDGDDRFAGIPFELTPGGAPYPNGCLASLDCRLVQATMTGNHTVFIGQVESGQILRDARPLLYYDRDYRHLAG